MAKRVLKRPAASKTAAAKDRPKKVAKPAQPKESPVKKTVKDKAAKVKAKEKSPVEKAAEKPKPKKVRKKKEPPRLCARWGVFDAAMRQVAVFDYNQRAEADRKVADLKSKKANAFYFLQIVKEPMPEPAAEEPAAETPVAGSRRGR